MKRNVILAFIGLTAIAWISAINDMISTPQIVQEHLDKAESFENKEIFVDAVL